MSAPPTSALTGVKLSTVTAPSSPRCHESRSSRSTNVVAIVLMLPWARTRRHMQPVTRYAKSGESHIAYQVVGNGTFDVVFVPGFISNLDLVWDDPPRGRFLNRIAAYSRLILFDKRGTGLSDRVGGIPGLEQRMDDVRAVMDAAGSERAAIFGISEGGAMAMLFAATYPERTRALVLYGTYAHYPSWVLSGAALEE